MSAGRSTTPRTRKRSLPLSTSTSSSSSWSMKSVLLLLCCTFLVVVDIEFVTSMSIDRLGIERSNNEIQSEKSKDLSEQKISDLIVQDEELEAVSAGGETELYVRLPSGSKNERESVEKNSIEADENQSTAVQENGGDMIMMESQDVPVAMQVAKLPTPSKTVHKEKESEVEKKETVENDKKDNKIKDAVEANKEKPNNPDDEDDDQEEPIRLVFKNDKDIEDMDKIENESDKETDSSEDSLTATQTGDVEREGEDEPAEPASMVELFADVVEEVEKEIESELGSGGEGGEETNEAVVKQDKKEMKPKDEEQTKWEETVEKLEKKGSEKHKEQGAENEAPLDVAASVMEEIMPEEVVEAMAMAQLTDSSSEENENNKEENKKKSEKAPMKPGKDTAEVNKKEEDKKQNIESEKDEDEHKRENEAIKEIKQPQSENLVETIKKDNEKSEEITAAEADKPKEPDIKDESENSEDIEDNEAAETIQNEKIEPAEETKLTEFFVLEDQKPVDTPVAMPELETLNLTEDSIKDEETEAAEETKLTDFFVLEVPKLPDTAAAKPELETSNVAVEVKPNDNEKQVNLAENEDEAKKEVLNDKVNVEVQKETNDNKIEYDVLKEESKPVYEVVNESKLPLSEQEESNESQNVDKNKESDETKEIENEEIKPAEELAEVIEPQKHEETTNEKEPKPENVIMQADEQPIVIDLDQNSIEYNKVEEILENGNKKQTTLEPASEIADEVKLSQMPPKPIEQYEPVNEINENKNEVEDEKENNNETAAQSQEHNLEESPNEEDEEQQEAYLSPPQMQLQLPQKIEEPEAESEPTNNKKETDKIMLPDSTMLTTIIQTPSQEQQQQVEMMQLQMQLQQQQQEQQQLEQQPQQQPLAAATQQDEMHNQDDSKVQNEQIASEIVATSEMTIASSTQAPQNVAILTPTQDSVLSYVNETTIAMPPPPPPPPYPAAPLITEQQQQEQQKQQQQQPSKVSGHHNETEDLPFNAQLRRYDGAQVWRIVVQSDRDRRLADELQTKFDGQLWKEVKQEVDYLLKPQVLADAEKHIRAANLSRIVLIDNLQKVIEVENPAFDELADADNEKGHRLTWSSYHRLADIHDFFDYLAKTYPEICAVETIGYSIEKRPLKVLKISNGNAGNPSVWIDAGMHAREWISPASVTYIANQIAEGWESLPSYMQNVNWYIHAVANPDGYEYTHTTDRLWRKNMRSHGRACPGVDLNRNFGYKWGGKGTSANPCSQTYRGSKAFSEPETFYISKFISNFPRDTFHAFLSFHSYGQYILYPWGFDYMLTSDRSDLDRVARAAATTITRATGSKYTVGSSAVTLYPAAGGSDDWAKGIANIKYTYTIEMGDTGRYGFILPANQIESNCKDAYTFVQTVARAISHDMRKRTIKWNY